MTPRDSHTMLLLMDILAYSTKDQVASYMRSYYTVSSLKIRHIKKLIHSASPNFDIYLESNYHKTISCRNNKKLNCVEIVI